MMHTLMITVVVALAAGVLVQVIAHHLRFPAIAILLLAGIGLGPQGLGWVQPQSLGAGFEPLVGLAVAVILFEGGLTLDLEGFRTAPRVIRRLITTGAIITWLSAAALAMVGLDLDLPTALLAGSLIIVTGPTVVTPLLRRIGVTKRLHHVLHWEAVLIDPVGVFIALLCYEWVILSADTGAATVLGPLGSFALRVLAGTTLGILGGAALAWALRRHWVPGDHANITVFTGALLLYGVADLALPHTGILAVTIAGLVLGWQRPPQLPGLLAFKLEMTELAVAFLFILLAAELRLESFAQLGLGGALVVGAMILVVRPLVVMVATWRESMSWRERAFLSWIAPRGIVAASMASLFAFQLRQVNMLDGAVVAPFTFAVIGATVLLQGSTAGWLARALGVKQARRDGWLIVGANRLGREIARALSSAGVPTVLVDRNADEVAAAEGAGLTAVEGDAFDATLVDDPRLAEIGCALMVTENPAANELLAERWRDRLDEPRVHSWSRLCTGSITGRDMGAVKVEVSLAMPGRVSEGLESGQLEVRLVAGGLTPPEHSRVLLQVANGSAHPAGPQPRHDMHQVVLAWRSADAGDLFRRVVQLHGREPSEQYRQLAEAAVEVLPELSLPRTLEALQRQSGSYSVAIGNGVAIPHVTTGAVTEPMCVVGIIPEPRHENDARVVCLLISPAGAQPLHLEALARIAAWASSRERVHALVQASSSQEALAVLNASAAA